jgi:hypothetical protein
MFTNSKEVITDCEVPSSIFTKMFSLLSFRLQLPSSTSAGFKVTAKVFSALGAAAGLLLYDTFFW